MSERERIEDEHGAGAALGMLMAFLMMLCLGGCDDHGPPRIERISVPMELEGFEGCVFGKLSLPCEGHEDSPCGWTMDVVRCPNSTTTAQYRYGKITKTTVVRDGGTP